VFGVANWFANLPGASGSWIGWTILSALLLAAPSWSNFAHGAVSYALALTLLIYFLLDDRGIVIWSGLGSLLAFAQGSMSTIPVLKLLFPGLTIGMLVWCIWRWLCDTRIMNELEKEKAEKASNRTIGNPQFEVAQPTVQISSKPYTEITHRNVWAELVLSLAGILAICSWISQIVLREPIFTATWTGLGFSGQGWPNTVDSFVDGSRKLRYIAVAIIFAFAMIDASLVAAVVRRIGPRAMHPHHRHLYKWREILPSLYNDIKQACNECIAYMKSLWKSFLRILGLNVQLLGYLAVDIIFRGPAALAIGAIVYIGIGDLVRGSGGAGMAAAVALAIALLAVGVQYRHISLDGISSGTTRHPKQVFIASFLINVLRVWCALVLACVVRYGLAQSRFAWVPVPPGMTLAIFELAGFISILLLIASAGSMQRIRDIFGATKK
jgi:hypothetical protein